MPKEKPAAIPVPPTSEILAAAVPALRNAEFALFDCGQVLTRLGRTQAAGSCEKYRQQCLEVLEMVEGPEPKLLRRAEPSTVAPSSEAPPAPIPQV